MNLERLILLRDIFQEVPEEHVDMDQWLCGSCGCVIGHGASDPRVQALGLKLDHDPDENISTPVFAHHTGYSAVARFLETTRETAIHLFAPWNYQEKTKEAVLARLNKTIEDLQDA